MWEICSTLTIKTPERGNGRRSGVFFVNFEQISHFALVFSLLTLNKQMPVGVSQYPKYASGLLLQISSKLTTKKPISTTSITVVLYFSLTHSPFISTVFPLIYEHMLGWYDILKDFLENHLTIFLNFLSKFSISRSSFCTVKYPYKVNNKYIWKTSMKRCSTGVTVDIEQVFVHWIILKPRFLRVLFISFLQIT